MIRNKKKIRANPKDAREGMAGSPGREKALSLLGIANDECP
jgi:hypothetical protein